MNQITTRYITENGACYEQYVITDPEAKTALTITPERGGMITSFTLDGEEFVWTRRPNFSECNRPRFGVPVLFPSCGNPDNGVHIFDGKAYPMETHGFADLCAWEVESVGPDGVTLALESADQVPVPVRFHPAAQLQSGGQQGTGQSDRHQRGQHGYALQLWLPSLLYRLQAGERGVRHQVRHLLR